jgi:hypothetical protein
MRLTYPSKFLSAGAIAAAAFAMSDSARADELFEFNYSLPGTGATPMPTSASGYLITSDPNGGNYTVLDAFGTWNGLAITGVAAPGTFGGNDNILNTADPFFTLNGLSFSVNGAGDNGAGLVNLFYDISQGGYNEYNPNVGSSLNISVTPATLAPVLFDFSYSIPGQGSTPLAVSASGMLTTYHTYGNNYFVTGVSGVWNGTPILGALDPGTFPNLSFFGFTNDNLLTTDDPYLTINGLSFALVGGTGGDDGSGNVNVFSAGGYTEFNDNVGFTPDFNLSQVPEPSSWISISGGLLGIALQMRRKARKLIA